MRRGIVIGLSGAALIALLVAGKALRERQDAAQLLERAERALSAPLSAAPELSTLSAAGAIALLERASDLHASERAQGMLAWARALESVQKGNAERALRELAPAFDKLGERPELWLLRANALLRADRARDAHAALGHAGVERTSARGRLLAADLALGEERAADALRELERLRSELPSHAGIENRRGVALEALGRSDEALAAYELAATHDPGFAHALVNQGRLLRASDRHREAELAFSLAVQRGPDDAEAWLGRGLSRIAQGDLSGGRLDLERSREIASDRPEALIALADLEVHKNELARAIDRYRAALLLAPEGEVAWLKLGNALMRARKHEDARQAFERAIAHAPELSAAHNGLGAARMALGDATGAAAALEAAAALDQSDPNPLKNLALLRERQGDKQGARQARQDALARLR
jgi:tetratricopeptide (TPR) repeat protein